MLPTVVIKVEPKIIAAHDDRLKIDTKKSKKKKNLKSTFKIRDTLNRSHHPDVGFYWKHPGKSHNLKPQKLRGAMLKAASIKTHRVQTADILLFFFKHFKRHAVVSRNTFE